MEVSDKDIYEYIVGSADDRTVLNMLSVNKKFNDDSYFKKILENRYPLLLRFKKNDETYKRFYLREVKYMAKLWEEYEIPYIPTPDYDPEYLYVKFGKDRIYTTILMEAVEYGDINLAKHLINKGAEVNRFTYISAAIGGNLDTLKFLIDNYPPKEGWLNRTFWSFAEQKKNIVDYLKQRGL